jgi:peptide/nickel transport system substrate-binding protein
MPIEPDLAESWTQASDTTYIFKLRKGVRWHNKPPVNGRELTAEDLKYTYERLLTVRGNPNRSMLDQVEKIEALDRYTVKFTLSEPFAWFVDYLATTVMWILPREAVERYGDLRRASACWLMLAISTASRSPWRRPSAGARTMWTRSRSPCGTGSQPGSRRS